MACTFIVALVSNGTRSVISRIHPRLSGSLRHTHILLIIATSLEDPPDTAAAVSVSAHTLLASRRVSDSARASVKFTSMERLKDFGQSTSDQEAITG